MTTVQVYSAERMLEIEESLIVGAEIEDGRLILTRNNGGSFDAGPVGETFDGDAASIVSGTLAEARVHADIARVAAVAAAISAEVSDRNTAITTAINNLLTTLTTGAPGLLDDFNELAAAIGDDPNFATTMLTALSGKQPLETKLTNISALSPVADRFMYFTSSTAVALGTLTTFARSLLDDGDAAAACATLGLGTAALLNTGTSGGNISTNTQGDARWDAIPLTGTAAALTTANPVLTVGRVAKATDAPYWFVIGDGSTALNSLPKFMPADVFYQYAYTETSQTAVATNVPVDWTGLSIVVVSDGITAIDLEAFCPTQAGDSGMTLGAYGRLIMYDGATALMTADCPAMQSAGTNGRGGAVIAKDIRVHSAGSHTFKVTVNKGSPGAGAGTITFSAFSGGRAYIRSKAAHG